MGSKPLKAIAPVAGAVLGSVVPGVGTALGAGIGGAIGGASGGGGLKGALVGGATGYGGSVLGSSIGSSISGTLGKVGGSSIGSLASPANAMGPFTLGNIGGTAANALANTTLSTGLGQYAGNSIANSLKDSLFGQPAEAPQENAPSPQEQQDSPFAPQRSAQLNLPNSLSGMSDLTPDQLSSNIATQGVYGGGQGPEEENYFLNMINRRLVDDKGQVDPNLGEISPIENSYLSQLGFSGYDQPTSLLEALSKWKRPQMAA